MSEAVTEPGNGEPAPRGVTGKLISSYYLEIEYVLDRVESSSTHYQALGLDRSARSEELVTAYQETVKLLHPPDCRIRAAIPDQMLSRIDEAFTRVSEAFCLLIDPAKRSQYDPGTGRWGLHQLPVGAPAGDRLSPGEADPSNSARAAGPMAGGGPAKEFTGEAPEDDRRRCERYKFSLPALVSGCDQSGNRWKEVTKTIDVSRAGAAVLLARPVRHGTAVHLRLPMPVKLRGHSFAEPGYSVYGVVRRVELPADGLRVVGLEFVGERPPAEYIHKPWTTFGQNWKGGERRKERRQSLAETVGLLYLDEFMRPIGGDSAVIENVSASGARLFVKAAPAEFDIVRITADGRKFESLAAIRNRYVGADGLERLCVRFIESKWPSEIV